MLTMVSVIQFTTILTTSSAMPFPIPREIQITSVTIVSVLTTVVIDKVILFTHFKWSNVILFTVLDSNII